MRIYLASPYGFAEATKSFLNDSMILILKSRGHIVLNPWDLPPELAKRLGSAQSISDYDARQSFLAKINTEIASLNEKAIQSSDIVVAVLDGQEVDSGVAAEIGFARALGKKIIGYRGDFRLSGENIGCRINLQVQYFVEASGGLIVSSLEELEQQLTDRAL